MMCALRNIPPIQESAEIATKFSDALKKCGEEMSRNHQQKLQNLRNETNVIEIELERLLVEKDAEQRNMMSFCEVLVDHIKLHETED